MFTKADLINNITLLKRTTLKGEEAIILVELLTKLTKELDRVELQIKKSNNMEKEELEVSATEEMEINPETVSATDVVVSDEEKEGHE